jgi:alginate O-acetyltransferase complex protein AlgI
VLFNSWDFVLFLALVFAGYYSAPRLGFGYRHQIAWLFVSSLVFYSYESPALVILLLVSIAINGLISKFILTSSQRFGKGVSWVWIGVAINLLVLAFFKYAFFIADTLLPQNWFGGLVDQIKDIPLPVGISFYTFQAITLIVDLHRKGVAGLGSLESHFKEGRKAEGFLSIAFYIAFFPQLVAGPIVKAHDFICQIEVKRLGNIRWDFVVKSLVIGYFLKMVVADNLKDVTYLLNTGAVQSMGKIDLVMLLYGYSIQIFADFAGYSLIAIGLGALFGYKFPENFNYPYISQSVTEFWRRWHISLSSFLKEYLYIPLGGNRKGPRRTYFNLFVVMFLGGLWHGAAWSYAVWGVSHGVLLALEKFYANRRGANVRKEASLAAELLKILTTFQVVSFLWLLFLMPEFSSVVAYFKALFAAPNWLTSFQTVFVVVVYSLPVVVYHVAAYLKEKAVLVGGFESLTVQGRAAILSVMLFFIVLNSGTHGEFVYFQF